MPRRAPGRALAAAACVLAGSCVGALPAAAAVAGTDAVRVTRALRAEISTIVVIYAENRSFDSLYGHFPGARGLDEVLGEDGRPLAAYAPQRDRDGTVLPTLPKTWGGVTERGFAPAIDEAMSAGLPNAPFSIQRAFAARSHDAIESGVVTRDLVHRFFEHQMQIDGGSNDQFAAWSDAGGLTMGYYDYGWSALYSLAREFVLADEFFQGAFGGSFLNHQYLICACAPEYPAADVAPAKPSISVLETDAAGRLTPRLATQPNSPRSALDGPPRFVNSGSIAPRDFFGDGKFHAVNTMQPPYQPSGNAPAPGDSNGLYADPAKGSTLPPQSEPTIADRLDARRIPWAWYAGAWRAAVADGSQPPRAARRVIYAPDTPAGNPDFQPHHQPFNYYAEFDPATGAARRAAHLKDYTDFVADMRAGRLPAVAFYKPQGNLNQHPGYASVGDGDAHIADLVAQLRKSPQWAHMLIVITYDEFGGAWDHVPPPKADALGPGSRIPAIIVSPYARKGIVDHTPYDTGSILRLIIRRFGLDGLPGIDLRDRSLAAHGEPPLGDLTAALRLE